MDGERILLYLLATLIGAVIYEHPFFTLPCSPIFRVSCHEIIILSIASHISIRRQVNLLDQ